MRLSLMALSAALALLTATPLEAQRGPEWAFSSPVRSWVPVAEADVRQVRRSGAGAFVGDRLVFVDLRGEGARALLATASGPLTIRTDDASLADPETREAVSAHARRHDLALVLIGEATDATLAHTTDWRRLKRVYVSASRVTDAGLAHLAGATQLEVFYAPGKTIGDAGLAHLKNH